MDIDKSGAALEIAEQLVRGEIALSALREINAHVAEFDHQKAHYDEYYATQVHNQESILAARIAGSVRRGMAALETVGTRDDDIDDDDDD